MTRAHTGGRQLPFCVPSMEARPADSHRIHLHGQHKAPLYKWGGPIIVPLPSPKNISVSALITYSPARALPAAASLLLVTTMSGLIDIWTLERERMVRAGGAPAVFSSVASLGASARRASTARSGCDGRTSGALESCCGNGVRAPGGVAVMDAAEKQAAAAAGGSAPALVREDAFLSILVDCFGQ